MSNFIEKCIVGDALLSDVDDYIDEWHDGDSTETLHEFLGMNKKEYSLFVKNSAFLPIIITAHKDKERVEEVAQRTLNTYAMAARSDDQGKAELLNKWLTEKNLW